MSHKIYISLIVLLLGIATAKHFYDRYERNELISNIKEDLGKEKEIALTKISDEINNRDIKIDKLLLLNKKANEDSKYWYNQAKKKVVNPDYDIDFITAANILANSKYRPDRGKDSIR